MLTFVYYIVVNYNLYYMSIILLMESLYRCNREIIHQLAKMFAQPNQKNFVIIFFVDRQIIRPILSKNHWHYLLKGVCDSDFLPVLY
jgi:transposase-like protein